MLFTVTKATSQGGHTTGGSMDPHVATMTVATTEVIRAAHLVEDHAGEAVAVEATVVDVVPLT